MLYSRLKAFWAVATAGGFSAGAKLLAVTQPAVSRQVQELEAECGDRLFHRAGRRTWLTPAGEHLLPIAQRLVDAELDAMQLLSDSKTLARGHLKIAAVGPYHLVDILDAFHRRHPGVQVTVSIGGSGWVEQAVMDYAADVGLLALEAPPAACAHLRYRRNRLVVIAPRGHALASRTRIRLRDLHGQTLIAREPGSTTRRLFEAMLRREQVRPRTLLEIGSREAIRLAVARGLGLGYVSECEAVPHPDIVSLAVDDADLPTEASLIWRREREAANLVAAFLEIARPLAEAAPAAQAPACAPLAQ